ncbi:glycosyl transferase family protein [Escherichia coli]|nr:glycosyl transferase family protein [Escherichia coli]SQY99971.1 glycosyl transferase family protein [Escherichia coli]
MAHDVPLGCAPDEYDDLISGTCSHLPLFIPQLFREYKKVVFIDSDTVVKADLATLLDVEIGTNLVAAVKDIVMEGFVKFGTMSESDDGIMPAEQYGFVE